MLHPAPPLPRPLLDLWHVLPLESPHTGPLGDLTRPQAVLEHLKAEAGEVVAYNDVRVHTVQLGQEIAQHGSLGG